MLPAGAEADAALMRLSRFCGVDEQSAPFGLQLIAPLRADDRLLGVASAIEAAFATEPELRRPLPQEAMLAQAQPALKSLVTHPPHMAGITGDFGTVHKTV